MSRDEREDHPIERAVRLFEQQSCLLRREPAKLIYLPASMYSGRRRRQADPAPQRGQLPRARIAKSARRMKTDA